VRATKLKVVQGGRKRGNKLWRAAFAVGMAALALFLLWNSMGYLALWAADVTVVTKTTIASSTPVQCFVLRNEHLLRAPGNGKYIPLVNNGARVRVGQDVGRIEGQGGTILIQAPVAGLIFYELDGFEGHFPPDSLDLALVESVTKYMDLSPESKKLSQVGTGDAVGVIVGNTGFQLLTSLNVHYHGKRLKINAEDGGTYTIIPREVIQVQGQFWVLWDVISLSESLGMKRVFSAQLVTDEQEAVLVPAKALCIKDGEQGVLVLFRGKPVFNKVTVLLNQGDQVGVNGLAHGQRVLTLPWWANFVKRWWLR